MIISYSFFSNSSPYYQDIFFLDRFLHPDPLSGKFSSLSLKEIPYIILNNLLSSDDGFSLPIETQNGYALIYLDKHNKEYVPNLKNSWNLIYQYAKQERQNRVFQKIVSNIKNKTYIKNYYR